MRSVIDCNVPIAANGRNTHAGPACQYSCIELIEAVVSEKRHVIVLDDIGLLLDEYRPHLHYRGQPGLGDLFFKYLHDHMYGGRRVIQVRITPIEDDDRGFAELPNNTIDKSDRKFLAAALVSGGRIVNALDSDWHEKREEIAALGVPVTELCAEHACVGE